MKYSASFTAGALMRNETLSIIRSLLDGLDPEEVNPDVLDVNSIRGRRRKTSEILKRLEATDRTVWQDLPEQTARAQHMALYYCCLKAYHLVFDFHMDVVLSTWRSSDQALQPYDVQRFLEQRADSHPEVDTWSESTWEKIRQVLLKMLREAGLLADGRLRPVALPDGFWHRFVHVGDIWFLEAAFLNKPRRSAILQSSTSP